MAIANLRINSSKLSDRPYGVTGRTASEVKANAIEVAANLYKSQERPKIYAFNYKHKFN